MSTPQRANWPRLVLGAALVALIGMADAQTVHAPHRPDAFAEQVDALVREGFEHPEKALRALRALPAPRPGSVDDERARLLGIGSIEAQDGNAAGAAAVADELLALWPDTPAGRSGAASTLVRALVAENASQLDVAAALVQAALPTLLAGCPGESAEPSNGLECDYRPAWRALQILERRAASQGLPAIATTRTQSALALAEWAGDVRRRITNLSSLALRADDRGDREAAQRLIAQARKLAWQTDDAVLRARVGNAEAQLAQTQGDMQAAVRFYNEALTLATQADAQRTEALLLNNLSDTYAHMNRPADALRTAERALTIVRLHHDLRLERVLINNAGIAKIGLGRVAEGKRDLTRLLELWQSSGDTGQQAATLLEFGEALAAAGDARGALELYHRERTLSAELMQANRKVALKELQIRNDAEGRQREIELLGRDNALKTAELANRDLQQHIYWLLAAVMLLACALVAMLYRRVRETHRKLEASHAQLRARSERDALTNLANRRHFQALMTTFCAQGSYEGAMLLVDIDHFKRVNDVHGHAAGDQVLIEVARRLNEAVRNDDLVVRWGGEEFLIASPHAAHEQALQMAARVLSVIGGTPIMVGQGDATELLRVTASIGYGHFPLSPYGTAVQWEQAVNLADMALYAAKHQGRNRAVGIATSTAATHEALLEVEADFERARREGRVTLLQTQGPELRDTASAA